jgi:hypothetical protein
MEVSNSITTAGNRTICNSIIYKNIATWAIVDSSTADMLINLTVTSAANANALSALLNDNNLNEYYF